MKRSAPECWLASRSAQAFGQKTFEPPRSPSNNRVNLQGFADLDDNVTPAYQNIRAKVRIRAGGNEKAIAELLKFATSHSPMCDSVGRPVDVSFSLVHNGMAIS